MKFAAHPLLAHDPVFVSHWFWHKLPSPGNDVCDDERWEIFTLSLHFLWSFLAFTLWERNSWSAGKLGPASKKPEWPDSSWIRFAIPDSDSTRQCFREDGESEQVDLTAELECLFEFLYELTTMCEFACILLWSLRFTELNESESWTAVAEEPTNEPLRCKSKWGELFISPELWTFVKDQVLLIDWTLPSMESKICLRFFLLFMLQFPRGLS